MNDIEALPTVDSGASGMYLKKSEILHENAGPEESIGRPNGAKEEVGYYYL